MARLTIDTPIIKTLWHQRWQPEFVGTLLFLVDADRVLLIEKKTGHGSGKVNAPGGKWELGETLQDCARREMLEETGIEAEPLGCVAELRFVERNGPQWLGYVFVARDFSGHMGETPEARPFWCPLGDIPYEQMWADDAIWLPQVLKHGLLTGHGASTPLVYDLLFEAGEILEHHLSPQSVLSQSVHTPRSGEI